MRKTAIFKIFKILSTTRTLTTSRDYVDVKWLHFDVFLDLWMEAGTLLERERAPVGRPFEFNQRDCGSDQRQDGQRQDDGSNDLAQLRGREPG